MNSESIEARVKQLVKDGDCNVLDLIYDTFAQMLLAVLVAHLRNRSDAEDVLQQLFIDLAQRPRQLLKPRRLAPWLCTKARNMATDLQRQKTRRERRQSEWSDLLLSSVHTAPPIDEDALSQVLDSIPSKQREVVVMKAFQDKSFVEISELLGISQNTAASRYRYALEKMRGRLKSL